MAKRNILIIEDEKILAEDILRTLRNFKYDDFSIVTSGKETTVVESAHRCKNGKVIPVEVNAHRVEYQGEPVTLAVVRDITERKKVERELQESEKKYKALVENAPIGIYYSTMSGTFLYGNKKAEEIVGYRREELIGKNYLRLKLLDRGGLKKAIKLLALNKLGKTTGPDEFILNRKDGSKRIVEICTRIISINGKNVVQGMVMDITERKKAERRIKESEEKYRLISDSTSDLIAKTTFSLKPTFTYISPSHKKVLGYKPDEMIGKSGFDFLHPDDRKKLFPLLKKYFNTRANKLFTGKSSDVSETIEFRIKDKSGKWHYMESTVNLIKDELLFISKDITERKQAEEEKEKLQAKLIHSEKMAGVGTLASGIAHEFNNLLQIISAHTQFAQKTKSPEDIEESLDTVLDASDRATNIIKNLLNFSREEESKKELYDISELIESILLLTEEHLKKQNIRISRKFEKIPMIKINRAEMAQVFLNMITNARDAMLPKGGKLEVGIKRVEENIEVSLSDTGGGIEEENLSKVFEPFYTTKGAVGGSEIPGTGLGLSVAYGIVKRHGGEIEVESKVRRGTTFTVKLPVKGARPERIVKIKKTKEIKKAQPLNILVVDDEERICRIFTKYLSSEGHKVKAVTTGRKATTLIKKEYFDFVFLDIVMPGISGIEVLERIRKTSPETRVVMITGKLVNKDLVNELKQKGASAVLQKPFKINDIFDTISGSCDSPTP